MIRGLLFLSLFALGAAISPGQNLSDRPRTDSIPPTPIAGRAYFLGNQHLSSAYLADRLSTRPGDPLDSLGLARDLMSLAQTYAENGYPHANISLSRLEIDSGAVDRWFSIEEGPRVILVGTYFRGNRATRPQTLIRLAGLLLPRTFNSREIEAVVRRLSESGLFLEPPSYWLEAVPGNRGSEESIVFQVKERPYHRVFGALGYQQSPERRTGRIVGALSLSLDNIAGTARSFQFDWSRPRPENSALVMRYTEPWILGYPLSGRLEGEHCIEDSSFVRSRINLLLALSWEGHLTMGVGGGLERVVPGQARLVEQSMKYSLLWHLGLDYGLRGTGRDHFSAGLKVDYGRKRYRRSQKENTVARLWLDGQGSKRLWPFISFSQGAHARAVVSHEKPVPRPEQFTLGGAGSLRGYFEDQFIADQVAWERSELQLIADRRLAFHLFGDVGYFWDGARGLRGIKAGYGGGFRLSTNIGQVRLDYGWGEGDGLWDGKIHLMVDSRF